MDIASFEVSPDKRVTVHMIHMPPEVRTNNTTMYIGATPVGQPEEVSFGLQTIVFSAREARESGKIGIIAMLDDDQLDAQSAEDYQFVPEPPDTKPEVSSVNPSTTTAGRIVTLKGKRLDEVRVLSFTFMMGDKMQSYTSTQVRPTPDGRSLTCTLPSPMFKGVYLIGLGLTGGDRFVTQRRLTIED